MGSRLTSDFEPVPIPRQLSVRIYDLLARGELRPGAHLNEYQLSQRFGVSRAPLREAARILEQKGLVEWSPRRGFFVKSLSPRDVEELFQVRIWFETLALRQTLSGSGEVPGLQPIVSSLRLRHRDSDHHLIIEGDMDLHRCIVAGPRNARLSRQYEEICNEVRLALSYTSRTFTRIGEMLEFHEPILSAITDGDHERACRALTEHLEASRDKIKLSMAG